MIFYKIKLSENEMYKMKYHSQKSNYWLSRYDKKKVNTCVLRIISKVSAESLLHIKS